MNKQEAVLKDFMEFETILKEFGQENRLKILEMVNENPTTVGGIRNRLKKEGVTKSYTTVGRYIESLKNSGLLCSDKKTVHLTILGKSILKHFREARTDYHALQQLNESLNFPLELPEELLNGISVFKHARLMADQFALSHEGLRMIDSAKNSMIFLSKVNFPEFSERCFSKAISGVKISAVLETSMLKTKVDSYSSILQKFSSKEVSLIKKNITFKMHEKLPLSIMVVDDEMGGVIFSNPAMSNVYTPLLFSANKEFLDWVKSAFNWYWERGKEIEW